MEANFENLQPAQKIKIKKTRHSITLKNFLKVQSEEELKKKKKKLNTCPLFLENSVSKVETKNELEDDVMENLIEERLEVISVENNKLIPQMLSLKANVRKKVTKDGFR